MTRRLAKAVGAVGAGLVLIAAGCASNDAPPDPAWFQEAQAQAAQGDYPDLREIPQTTTANTDQSHWTGVAAELEAAADAMRAHPRAQPAPPENPDAFIEDARREIEATRDAH